MPLDKPTLTSELEEIFDHPTTANNARERARQMADAIEKYVMSGKVVGECPPEGGPLIEGKVT